MSTDPHDNASTDIPMPALSDHAVVQIHDFIAHFLDLFQARYGDQIHRYYEHRSEHNVVSRTPPSCIDDPPF